MSHGSSSNLHPIGITAPTSGYPIGSLVFFGIVATQFLGAFNDNYFKQLVLLKCVELARSPETGLQPMAMAAFALPFTLLSGFGGYLSDRISKRTVVVACKFAEILIMSAAVWILWPGNFEATTQLQLLIVVLAFMGAQSAIFGPSKYGILPELFDHKTLLPVNGAVQTTTFLAIIFGVVIAGIVMDRLNETLWVCSAIAVGIAVVGTLTSLFICPTPVAEPDIRLKPGNLFIPSDIRKLLRAEPNLIKAVLVMAVFWFIGGVTQPAVNTLGEKFLLLNRTRTSLLAAGIGIGIAMGCAVAGFANRDRSSNGARWTTLGSWMIFVSLVVISVLGSGALGRPVTSINETESFLTSMIDANSIEWALRGGMLLLGASAGIFVIPVQVYLQQTPPAELKGRMLGTLNFMTWIGILASAAFVSGVNVVLASVAGDHQQQLQYLTFAALAVFILPVALFYRLPHVAERSPAERSPAENHIT